MTETGVLKGGGVGMGGAYVYENAVCISCLYQWQVQQLHHK